MRSNENLMYEDFQGWPIYRMNVKEILEGLGIEFDYSDDNDSMSTLIAYIPKNILNIFPRVLEDDGMGYGVNERYITEVNLNTESKEPYCNIFAEEKNNKYGN